MKLIKQCFANNILLPYTGSSYRLDDSEIVIQLKYQETLYLEIECGLQLKKMKSLYFVVKSYNKIL